MKVLLPIAALLSAASCARPATRPASPARSVPTVDAAPPSIARVYHRSYHAVPDGWVDEHGDPRRAIVRGVRVELRGDDLRAADGWFAAPVQGAWEHDGRWIFAGRTARWESATYLGPLRELVRAPVGSTLGLGTGRPVLLRDGTATDIGLPDGVVLEVAFGDDAHGIALLEPGLALATDDGGQHWRSLAVDRPEAVLAVGPARWVRGAAECRSLDESGALQPCACESLPTLRTRAMGADFHALYERVRQGQEWAPMAFVDASQTRLLVRYEGATPPRAAVYDVVRDEVVAGSAADLPCDPRRVFTADRPYVECGGEDGATALWSFDGTSWRERMRTWGCGDEVRCAASANGARVSCSGRCTQGATCGAGSAFCERAGEGTPRETSVGSLVRRWRLAGYDGETRVLVDGREWLSHVEFIAGDAAPRRLVPSPPAVGLRLEGAPEVDRDGRLRLWVRSGRADGRRLLEGRAGETFAERPLLPWMSRPDAPTLPVRSCGGSGLLLAKAEDDVTWASAPGQDWRPLDSAEGVSELRAPASSPGSVVGCGPLPLRTTLGPGEVIGWGPIQPTRFGSVGDGQPERPAWTERPAWHCTHDGSRTAGRSRPRPEAAISIGRVGRDWVRPDGARVEFWLNGDATPTRPEGRSWWYRAGARLEMPAIGDRSWTVLSADARRASVLEITGGRPQGPSVGLVTFSADLPPRRQGFPEWALSDRLPSVLTVRDGEHLAALVVPSDYSTDPTPRSMGFLAVVPGAAPQLHWATCGRELGTLGIYVLDGRSGVARARSDGSVIGGPPGEAPRVLARSTSNVACGPSAHGAFTFTTGVTFDGREHGDSARAEYALDGDALCLRVLRADSAVVAPTAAGLTGVSDDGAPLRCTAP